MPHTIYPTEIKGPNRILRCGEPGCSFVASLPRRGAGRAFGTWHGNALATAAKLTGMLNRHHAERHGVAP